MSVDNNALVIAASEKTKQAQRRIEGAKQDLHRARIALTNAERTQAEAQVEGRTVKKFNGEFASIEDAESVVRVAQHGLEHAEKLERDTRESVAADLDRALLKRYREKLEEFEAALDNAAELNRQLKEIYEEDRSEAGRKARLQPFGWPELAPNELRMTHWKQAVSKWKDNFNDNQDGSASGASRSN